MLRPTDARRAEMERRVGFDNVQFRWTDEAGRLHTVIATIIGVDDDCRWIVGNPNWDVVWHIAVEDADITGLPLNDPPADW